MTTWPDHLPWPALPGILVSGGTFRSKGPGADSPRVSVTQACGLCCPAPLSCGELLSAPGRPGWACGQSSTSSTFSRNFLAFPCRPWLLAAGGGGCSLPWHPAPLRVPIRPFCLKCRACVSSALALSGYTATHPRLLLVLRTPRIFSRMPRAGAAFSAGRWAPGRDSNPCSVVPVGRGAFPSASF